MSHDLSTILPTLVWPSFKHQHFRARFYPFLSEEVAQQFSAYAKLHMFPKGDNAFLTVYVASRTVAMGEDDGVPSHGLIAANVTPRADDSWASVSVRRLEELRSMAKYLNGQLVPKGFRVEEILLVDVAEHTPEVLYTKKDGSVKCRTVQTLSIKIEKELWEQGFELCQGIDVSAVWR